MLIGYIFTLEKTVRQAPAATDETAKPERVRDHPHWVRLEQAILRALMIFPEALRAVSREIDAIEPAISP